MRFFALELEFELSILLGVFALAGSVTTVSLFGVLPESVIFLNRSSMNCYPSVLFSFLLDIPEY